MSRALCLTLIIAVASGCVSSADVRADIESGAVPGAQVVGVPFVEQRPDTCGAAALASVLQHDGLDVSEVAIADALRVQDRKGAITYELVVEARSHGVLAVQRYDVTPDVLMKAIDAGVSPVVLRAGVLLAAAGLNHYSVLTAYDRRRRVWVGHDGVEGDVVFSFEDLAADRDRAGGWAMFVVAPRERPSGLPDDMHLELGLQAEKLGLADVAAHHYRHAAWTPSSGQALLNMSNVAMAAKQLDRAEALLRMALEIDPDSAAVQNNLAWVIVETGGDLEEAEVLARAAMADEAIAAYALDTLEQILKDKRRLDLPDAAPSSDAPE